MDWKREIVIAHLVKQKVAEADVSAIWEHPFPEAAATEAEIQGLERHLGWSLDGAYRGFLGHANGWRSFMHSIDLFGVGDFQGRPRMRADALLETLEPVGPLCGFDRIDLIPFAVSANGIDVFAMTTPASSDPGKVFWFAGGLVDQFQDFSEWFLAMVDYNRLEYEALTEGQ